jgi:hypothetical protein
MIVLINVKSIIAISASIPARSPLLSSQYMDSLPARNPCIIPARILAITPTRIATANAVTMESPILSLKVSASWKKRIFVIESKNTAIAVIKPYSSPQREKIRSAKRDPIRRIKNAERMRDTSFLIISYRYTAFYGMLLFNFCCLSSPPQLAV